MKNTWWKVVFGVFCGLLGGGILFLISRSPQGQPVRLLPAPTVAPIQVYITGAVKQPGVYSLTPGSRVQDGIDLAGGSLPGANLESINLAAFLKDGDRIFVPEINESGVPGDSRSPGNVLPGIQTLIDINTASQAELESLPDIGPATALDIITYREQNGPFKTIEEIENVKGIGPKTFESIKAFITVGNP